MPQAGIHGTRSTSWNPASPTSKAGINASDTTNVSTVPPSATMRIASARAAGMTATTKVDSAGNPMRMDSSGRSANAMSPADDGGACVQHDIVPPPRTRSRVGTLGTVYDLAIVGAGPAGAAAALSPP